MEVYSWVARVVAGFKAGFDGQKSRVGSKLPLVQVSPKSVCRNPVKIGREVGHFLNANKTNHASDF